MNNTPKTIKLYDNDAYATEFDATVLSGKVIEKDGQVCYEVILDQTLFFPEEGGQTPDKGTINGMEVVDVQIENDIIMHYLIAHDALTEWVDARTTGPADNHPVLQTATPIHGRIDWSHRFSNMQQHSAEHIFSGLVHNEYGYNNVGFHLSDNIVTMDFDGVLTPEQIEDIEWKVNEAIVKNVAIDARYPGPEELKELEYRSKIEIAGPVRIVTIEGYDVCACCAPHVKWTGEIGMLKVMSVQNHRGGVRISILCGFRALAAFREKTRILSEISSFLSTSQDLAFERVSRLKEANIQLKMQLGGLKQEVMLGKIKEIPVDIKDVVLFEDELDTVIVRNVVNALVKRHAGACAVFVGNDTDGYSFILGSAALDCREIAVGLKYTFGAKCGGSQAMIQGSVTALQAELEQYFCNRCI